MNHKWHWEIYDRLASVSLVAVMIFENSLLLTVNRSYD